MQNISWGNMFAPKKAEPEAPPFKLNEQMTLDQIPNDILEQFFNVHQELVKNKEFIDKMEGKKTKTEDKKMRDEVSELREEAINQIFGDLMSIARQLDSGSKTLNEYKKDLEISKSDYNNSEQNRKHPTPFLLKYVSDVESSAESLSQSIAAYDSHLQSRTSAFAASNQSDLLGNNENQFFYNFLNEQSNAILRCSTKVAQLKKKMNQVRQVLKDKLKIDTFQLSTIEENTESANAQSINTKYQQFQSQKKQKVKLSSEQSDIFGNSTAPPEIPKSSLVGFNYGNAWGKSSSTGTGTNSKPSNTLTRQNANVPR